MNFRDMLKKIFGDSGASGQENGGSAGTSASCGWTGSYDAWSRVLKAADEGANVSGIVVSREEGGLVVDLNGIHAYLPDNLAELSSPADANDLVGRKLELRVLKLDHERKRAVVSRRDVLQNISRAEIQKLLAGLEPGQVIRGTVRTVNELGAFVDIGGIDGLLYAKEMSWKHVRTPSDIVSPGDEIEVMVLKVDRERNRVALGLRQLGADPWDGIDGLFQVGTVLNGMVSDLTDDGCFVDIGSGLEGFVGQADLNWTSRTIPTCMSVSAGDTVRVLVMDIDRDRHRIRLGLKQCRPNPWPDSQSRYHPGDRLTGRVSGISAHGCFVEIEEGFYGFVRISDMAWCYRNLEPSSLVKVGDNVQVQVLEIDEKLHHFLLGIKQCQHDPWDGISARLHPGDRITGRVSNIADYGFFVDIDDGVYGLVHRSEIDWTERNCKKIHPEDYVSIGDTVQVQVLKIDEEKHRISLGFKQCQPSPWAEFAAAHCLGDIVSGRISSIADFGIFVRLDGGIDGLVYTSELSRTVPGEEVILKYKYGDEIEAVVTDIHTDRHRISLSIKQLEEKTSWS